MNVFITGANGKIGSCLVSYFIKKKFNIFPITRSGADLSIDKNLKVKSYKYDELPVFISEKDVVIHAAGLSRSSNKKLLFDSNEKLTLKLVKLCEEKKYILFVLVI